MGRGAAMYLEEQTTTEENDNLRERGIFGTQ